MRILYEWTRRPRGTSRGGRRGDDLEEELRSHLEMAAEHARRLGLDAAVAARAARIESGGASQAMEALRDQRGLPWLDSFMLDCQLGPRIPGKYPGLTLVAGLGMAVGVAISAISFAFLYASLHPTLPLDEGERIVGLENWDTARNNQEERILHDFVAWRDELKSVQELSAFQTISRNVTAGGGRTEQASVAEMTASGFRVARVAPLLGRYLVDDDERVGASPVI